MKNLYLAHHIDFSNPMNIGIDATCNVLLNNLKAYNSNAQNNYVNRIDSLQDFKNFIQNNIIQNEAGTFIFYFNGSGHQEEYKKINIHDKKILSLIFKKNEIEEEVLNRQILELINHSEFEKINFYFILDTCNSGQFLNHAKEFNKIPITIITSTSEDTTTNTSVLSEFLNVISYGLFSNMLTYRAFEHLFNAWFGLKKTSDTPQFYTNQHPNKSNIFLI